MVLQARKQLITLQETLYKRAYKDAHALAVGTSRSLAAYSSRFEQSLPENFSHTTIAKLCQKIEKSSIVLYGDFHTLRQSQRGLVRIIREMLQTEPRKKISLALEAFRAADQIFLDGFQRGTLSEEKFLRKTDYHVRWGFPWNNFKMLLDFARDHGIYVFGINSENSGKDSLNKRDNFAAEVLSRRSSSHPGEIIFCLIGEHHLADNHLPKSILNDVVGRKAKVLRIVSNVDKYFFQISREKPTLSTEYLKLKDNLYCVMNSPPWLKWHSFTIWEELRSIDEYQDFDDELENEEEFEQYTEQTYDVDYHFLSIVKELAKFIGAKIPENSLSKFTIYSNLFSDQVGQVNFGDAELDSEIEIMLRRSNLDGIYFVSDSNVILLNDLSINNLSEVASQFIHKLLTGFSDTNGDESERFQRRIIKSMIGMLGSKMLNPKRKCLTLNEFRKYIKNNHRKRLSGHLKMIRCAYREIIRYHDWMAAKTFDYDGSECFVPRKICESDIECNFEISRAIGLDLGYQLYALVMSNKTSDTWIRKVFQNEISNHTDVWEILKNIFQVVYHPGRKKINI
ncbi:MAG: ChaN family lipoprotein [Bdellovibrionota bacterium]